MKALKVTLSFIAIIAVLLGAMVSPARAQKMVFAHYMVTNQDYGTGVAGYQQEIQQAQAAGIDGWALNCGGWSQQTYYQTYTANIFQAAHNLNSGFKLFFSADMCCGLSSSDVVSMMQTYGNDSAYFHYNGRPVLTTFSGQANGQSFWQGVLGQLSGMNVFFVPCFFPPTADTETPTQSEVQAQWNSWWGSVANGLFYWGVAGVPKSGYSPNQIPSSEGYGAVAHGAGAIYMAPVISQFWGLTDTANGRRYFEYSGGEGLRAEWMDALNTSHADWVEIPTWNDFNEGTYMSPIDDPNAHPGNYLYTGATGFYLPHQGFYDLMKYYIQWYKNGTQPSLSQDTIYWFYRTSSMNLTCGDTAVSQRYGPVADKIYLTCNLQSPATLKVTSGGVVTNISVGAGSSDVEVPFNAGAQNFQLIRGSTTVINASGQNINSSISVYNFLYTTGDASGSGGSNNVPEGPYGGSPAAIPGTVQAENYDVGGQGVGYSVSSVNGSANSYRSDGVDLETTTDTNGGYDLGWSASGQWFRYTVNVPTAGTYTTTFRVANGGTTNGSFNLQNSSGATLASVTVAPTGGWQTWANVTANVTLPAGQQVLTVAQTASGYNLNYMTFATQQASEGPYGGTPAAIPGTVQAENYDTGGEGVAYHDADAANQGGQYRTSDGVDVETCSDTGGGYDVGWNAVGEWMKYTVNVSTAGNYTVTFRVSDGTTANGSFHLQNAGGTNLTGAVTVTPTGGWQTWANVTATVNLPAGQQVIELYDDGSNYNINYMSFAGQSSVPPAPTGLSASAANSQVSLSWTGSSGATSYNLYRSTTSGGEGSTPVVTGISGTTYTNTGLTDGTTYYFKVAAVNSSGTSGQSNEASAKPAASGGEGPYGGTAAAIPGTVQSENYDTGGAGVGYNATAGNGSANSYRSDGIDLETTSDTGGGYDVGWTTGGQWFRYTVNVSTAGTYTVSFRVASPSAITDGFHLSNSSGTNLSGNVNVPATGGYQTWTTVTANVTLPAGQQVLTLNEDNGGWNINYMSFASSGGGTSGHLSGSVNAVTGSDALNMTSLGTTDWAVWGYNNTVFTHDASGGSQIGNVSTYGGGTPGPYNNAGYSYFPMSWTNGTPTASVSGEQWLYTNAGGVGDGFSFTVPASTTSHKLIVYVGGWETGGTLTATLSDGSAAAYTDSSQSNSGNSYYAYYTLTFNAASAGQTMTIVWKQASGTGNVDIFGAALQ